DVELQQPQVTGRLLLVHQVLLVVGEQLDDVVARLGDVVPHVGAYAVDVAGEHEDDVRVLRHDLLEEQVTPVRGEPCAPAVGGRGGGEVLVGRDDGVAVGVLGEDLVGPGQLGGGGHVAEVDHDEVQTTGSEQVVVVLVVP